MIRETSLDCFLTDQQRIQTKEQMIYEHLAINGKSCISDIAKDLKMRTSSVSARLNDLKAKEMIKEVGKFKSKSTGIMSIHVEVVVKHNKKGAEVC